jgi:hypothetical protein
LIMALGLDGGPTIAAAAIASFLPRSRASNWLMRVSCLYSWDILSRSVMDASNWWACSSITALTAFLLFNFLSLNLSGCLCSRPRAQTWSQLASEGWSTEMRRFISSLVARITSISYLWEERRQKNSRVRSGLSAIFHLLPQVKSANS